MRNSLPFSLILLAMIMAAPACMAQARDDAPHELGQAAEPARDTPHRSAFGRVMAVMIDALQREAVHQDVAGDIAAKAAPEVRTSAIGTPLGIEVGDAFSLDARPQAPKPVRTEANASMPLAVQAGSDK